MTRYLISLSIGPVQDFIAAARRTADLYAGSQLLMEVVGAAAEEFADEERIYPADTHSGGANKILAVVAGDPAQRAKNAERRARERLKELWNETIAPLRSHIDQKRAEVQLASLLEVYAAWTPLLEGAEGYGSARRRVERLLAGRKALRDFAPTEQRDAGVPKSPLDPAFAAVLKLENGQVPQALRDRHNFKPTEVLDAVSLLKRLYGRGELKDKVLNTHTLAHRAKHPDAPNSDEDDFVPDYSYFAILIADGDNMGRLLSQRESEDAHHELSRRLDTFAAQARDIVKGHQGMAVFAGGDDVLALLPVTTALECGQKLADAFRQHLSAFGSDTVTPSLSAGIAIVHYREPLSASLNHARAAEKRAKAVPDKDAICVALHTRGGAPLAVAQKWDEAETIQTWQNATLPRGLPHELFELAREWPEDVGADILTAEAKRIAKRKSDRDANKVPDDLLKKWGFDSTKALETFSHQLILARFLSGKGDRP